MTKNRAQKAKNKPGRKLGVKVKHGAYSLIARGALPQKRRYLEAFLSEVRRGLIRDLGPKEQDLSTAELILLDRVIGKLGVLRVVEEFAKEEGVLQGKELSPILQRNYLAWANSLRLDLQALGLDKRAVEHEPTLAEIIREFDENKKSEQEAQAGREGGGEGDETGEREKIHCTHFSREGGGETVSGQRVSIADLPDGEPGKLLVD